jgi:hypothetical protein
MATPECDLLQKDFASLRIDIVAATYTLMIVMLLVVLMLCRATSIINHISRELEFGNHVFSSKTRFGPTPPWEAKANA